MTARPKFEYIRNNKLLLACRHLACQHCGIQDGTIVAAHSNQSKHGKGKGIKASDQFIAALCHACHMLLDQGAHLTEQQRVDMWDAAHKRTVKELMLCGLWPSVVPLPSI